jgi:hypothetical protein
MNRKINITATALFLVLIFGFGVAFWVVPDVNFSEEEKGRVTVGECRPFLSVTVP